MSEIKVFSLFEARRLGESLRVDWKRFTVEQFHKGLEVEMEHGLCDLATNVTNSNPTLTAKIVLAHLNKIPDYYTRLEQMEREAQAA
jgi:hypothetical protein